MRIRLQNDGVAGASTSAASQTNLTQSGSSITPASGFSTGGADQVEISSLSESISSASSALGSQQADRVSQLAAVYAKGQYQVDSVQLSHALVSHALASGSVENDA
ncbi:MAG: flagellar biosynthesis anti-sigma factor FlgM [Bryobacteraceae bacterium]|jgi:anti-sigma28 factor (negative regulator of flagellin synthesis)